MADRRAALAAVRRDRATIAASVAAAVGAGARYRRASDAAQVARYLDELALRFSAPWHRATTSALVPVLARVFSPPGPAAALTERLVITGEVEALGAAIAAGPTVLAPSHAANLDAIVVGMTLERLGLPAAAYPVGEHLFRNPVIAALVQRLGGFRIDRDRTEPRYLATLGAYWAALVARGAPLVVFPAGTRNRSGAVDRSLRLGLVAAAARHAARAGAPVRLIPIAISARIVLEAAHLVDYHLRGRGHERVVGDELFTPGRLVATAGRLRALDQRVIVHVGAPRLLAGRVDPAALAADLAASYQAAAVHHDTQLAGRALDELIRRPSTPPAVRPPRPAPVVPRAAAVAAIARVVAAIDGAPGRGRRAAPARTPAQLLDDAVAGWRAGHRSPIATAVGADIVVDDPRLVWFYGNRLGPG